MNEYPFLCAGCGRKLSEDNEACPECGLDRNDRNPADDWMVETHGLDDSPLIAIYADRLFRIFRDTLFTEYANDRENYGVHIAEFDAGEELFEYAISHQLINFSRKYIPILIDETDDIWESTPPEHIKISDRFEDILTLQAQRIVYQRFVRIAMARGYSDVISAEL